MDYYIGRFVARCLEWLL